MGCPGSGRLWRPLQAWLVAALSAMAQAGDLSAPLHKVDGSFVREWLVLGPFPSRDLEPDFLAGVGGEANVRPKEGDEAARSDGTVLKWTRHVFDHNVVNLGKIFGIQPWSVAYVYCELTSDQQAAMDAWLPPSASFLWVNGTKVEAAAIHHDSFRGVPVSGPIPLKNGVNACLIKVGSQGINAHEWTFSFQPLPPESASIELKVTDGQERPVPSAVVQLYHQGELVGRAATDEMGRARACLFPLAPTYDVRVTSAESGAWIYDVALRLGERRRLNAVLSPEISISGRTLARDGTPQSAIVVQALRVEGTNNGPQLDPQLGASLVSPALAVKEQARPVGELSARYRQSVESASGRHFTVGEDFKVRSALPMPPGSETVHTDTNGHFRFINLLPGVYRLRCQGPLGYIVPAHASAEDEEQTVTVAPGRTNEPVLFRFADAKKGTWGRFQITMGLQQLPGVSIHRTPDGLLWVGSPNGTVHQYDGVEFKMFSGPQIPGGLVQVISHDARGAVWIGTSGGISRKEGDRFQPLALDDLLPRPQIWSILADPDGSVWFGSASGILRYGNGKATSRTIKDVLPSNEAGPMIRGRDGAIWVGTPFGPGKFENERLTALLDFSGPHLLHIRSVHQSKDKAIWFSSNLPGHPGVYRFDGSSLTYLSKAEGLLSDSVGDIVETSDGDLWFGTDQGLSRFNGTTFVNYTVHDGLGGPWVNDIFVDEDDVLWMADAGGVSRFDPYTSSRFDRRDGLQTGAGATCAIFTIERDPKDGFWAGTEWGGLYRLRHENRTTVVTPAVPRDWYVRNIDVAEDGTLWLGTAGGLFRWVNDSLSHVFERNWMIALARDEQNRFWYGHGWNGGGLSRYDPATGLETRFSRKDGLPHDSVWALARDPVAGVWIGTEAGVARADGDNIRDESGRLRIPAAQVYHLRHDSGGTLWVSTARGLYSWDGTNTVSITSSNGLPDEHIWCSAQTPGGVLWMGSRYNGLIAYDGRAMSVLDKRDGLLGHSVSCLAPDGDRSLWIGFLEGGLTRYRLSKTPPSVRLIKVHTEDASSSGFSTLPDVRVHTQISVEYREIDLKTHPEKRQFWYEVSGPSGDRLYSGVTRDRRFTWAPRAAGSYRFQVQAIDRDLNYSTPASFTIRAFVPWYMDARITIPAGVAVGGLVLWTFIARAIYVRQRREAEHLREQMLQQERQSRAALEEANRSLAEAKQAAEAANLAKSAFLANMSHEIRTPLNAVLGFAQILLRDKRLQSDQLRFIATIERSGSHLLRLINEILDLSKIEAGAMELVEVEFDLRRLVEDLTHMFEPRCREKGVRLLVEWHEEHGEEPPTPERQGDHIRDAGVREGRTTQAEAEHAPSPAQGADAPLSSRLTVHLVRGDEGKLRQALINILGNATKFTDAGEILLRVTLGGPAQHRPNTIESRSNGSRFPAVCPGPVRVTFEVKDTAGGIEPAVREMIFEPFTQGAEGRQKGGTGLGLPISRRQIALMGGELKLETELGKGSRFWFTLELAPARGGGDKGASRTQKPVRRLRAGIKVRALVADDVVENRDVLSWLLKDLGVEATIVEDGRQALEALQSGDFDIAFLDIRMPGLTGFQVAREALNSPVGGRTRLVAVSASVLKHEQALYDEAGFDGFIPKPFRFEELYECLAEQLGVEFEHEGPPAPGTEAPTPGPTSDPVPDPLMLAGAGGAAGTTTGEEGGGRAPEGAGAGDETLVDWGRLRELFGADEARRQKYLASYVRHTTAQLDQLRTAVRAGAAAEIEMLAHRCKGASGNLGIKGMVGPMDQLERAMLAHDLSQTERLLAEAEQAFEDVRRCLLAPPS